MDIVKTFLEWQFAPADLFEAPLVQAETDYEIDVREGRVTVTLSSPSDSVLPDLQARASEQVGIMLLVRALQVRRTFTLRGPNIRQIDSEGHQHHMARLELGSYLSMGGMVDFVHRDPAGRVVADSKAQRITRDSAELRRYSAASDKDPLVKALLDSWYASLPDPHNELVHLYEILDALRTRFGSEEKARATLRISKRKWSRLGRLANVEPLEQGRHRGLHVDSLRPATPAELDEARSIAQEVVEAFVACVERQA